MLSKGQVKVRALTGPRKILAAKAVFIWLINSAILLAADEFLLP